MLRLYSYFRSSAAYRVRIALNLKGLAYEMVPVHLLRDGGEQHSPAFIDKNPAQLVPVLEDDSVTLSQSLAIIEYLEEKYPQPALLPHDAVARAKVRALALSVACDIHPINNLRVTQYLKANYRAEREQITEWSRHWITQGLAAIECVLADNAQGSIFCFGQQPTLADCCLVPQVFNALRINCRMADYPIVLRIYQHCLTLDAFAKAAPEAQPDAE